MAAFIVEDGIITTKVVTVHVTWTGKAEAPGFPGTTFFDSFWDWLKQTVEDAIDWCDEEALAELLATQSQRTDGAAV